MTAGISSGTYTRMNSFEIAEPFVLQSAIPGYSAAALFTHEEAAPLEAALLDRLAALPPGGLLAVDFERTRIASEAARQLLRRAILRITSGEFEDRFLVLTHLDRSRYSVDAMLRREGLTTVERTPEGPVLIGQVERVAAETFAFASTKDAVTASMVYDHFELQGIATATNRLTSLAKAALVRRAGPRPLPSGGREYVYSAVH